MAIVFAARGNQFDARYSGGRAGAQTFLATSTSITANSADANAPGGVCWLFSDTNNSIKMVSYSAKKNTPNGRGITVNICIRPYLTTPASRQSLWSISAGGARGPLLELTWETTGNLSCSIRNEALSASISLGSFGTWTPANNTAYHDITFQWDGTTSANAVVLKIDNAAFGTQTAGSAFTSSWTDTYFSDISIGATTLNSGAFRGSVAEFIIDDNAAASTASWTGGARSYTSVSAQDSSVYTDPGVANVKSGTSYTYAGVSQSGTLSLPSTGDVRNGVVYGSSTGTCVVPVASDVRHGTSVDATVGTCYVPARGDVRFATNVDNTTGLLDLPNVANVVQGVVFDNGTQTGTYAGASQSTLLATHADVLKLLRKDEFLLLK